MIGVEIILGFAVVAIALGFVLALLPRKRFRCTTHRCPNNGLSLKLSDVEEVEHDEYGWVVETLCLKCRRPVYQEE